MAGPVVADLELEGVVEAALERFGQGCERERELRHPREQVRVACDVSWCGGLELGEFFGAGPVLGGQLSEAPLDALAVLLVGLGVAGVVLLFKPGDEVFLAPAGNDPPPGCTLAVVTGDGPVADSEPLADTGGQTGVAVTQPGDRRRSTCPPCRAR